jgi:hypothetical protein
MPRCTDAEKLACQCRVAPAAAMCQCQGAHQADFLNGCLRSAVPEGCRFRNLLWTPKNALTRSHWDGGRRSRCPFAPAPRHNRSRRPPRAVGSPLDLMVYVLSLSLSRTSLCGGAETVTEGYRVTARIDAEICTRYGGTLREPAEGELVPLGEARPCTFVRPQCPCSAPPSEEARPRRRPTAGNGDVPPSGSSPSWKQPA